MELKLDHMTLQLELPSGVQADPKLLDGGHPLHYVLKMRKQTENYLNRVHELLADVDSPNVLEFCAGIGLVCASNPQIGGNYYAGVELDANCEPLAKTIAHKMDFHLGDMYDPLFTQSWETDGEYTLVICEFPTNTLPKLWREPDRMDMMNRITQGIRPRHLYIADVGYYWIHLANHWPLYEKRFGVKPTRENYHMLFDQYARETWGYHVTKSTVGGGAQYFLLEPA
jgi:hypothetical protein